MKKFLCICFSSTLQKTVTFPSVKLEEVNRSDHYRLDASGKAVNAARILAQLEKDCVTTFCPLGELNYKDFEKLAKEDNLNLCYTKLPGYTRECITLLDKNLGTTTELVISEPVLKRTKDFEANEKNLMDVELPAMIDDADAVLLAGSRPGIWTDDMYPELSKYAVQKGKLLLVDFHGKDLIKTLEVCAPSIMKINEDEFSWTFRKQSQQGQQKSENKDDELTEIELKNLIVSKSRELNNIIIITRGTKSVYAANKGEFTECPIEKVKAVNTTACGDSFNAGFLYEYANTGNFQAALQKGVWCASRNAESEVPGTIK